MKKLSTFLVVSFFLVSAMLQGCGGDSVEKKMTQEEESKAMKALSMKTTPY